MSPRGPKNPGIYSWICAASINSLVAAQVLGTQRSAQLARAAEDKKDFWSAALRWSATAFTHMHGTSIDRLGSREALIQSSQALDRIPENGVSGKCTKEDRERLELTVLIQILQLWDPADLATYGPRMSELTSRKTAQKYPEILLNACMMLEWYPAIATGQFRQVGIASAKMIQIMAKAAASLPSAAECTQMECYGYIGATLFFDSMVSAPGFDFDTIYGVRGGNLENLIRFYDFETMYPAICKNSTMDGIGCGATSVNPLLFHYGDIAGANRNTNWSLNHLRQIMAEGECMT